MSAPLRVLVVDDSVVFRKIVSNVIAGDPTLQLAGTAANGRICMQKVQQLNPDVITLDLEMPEMDGFAVLREISQTHPHIRVIVFSAHSVRGAEQTFEAMRLGAADFLSKGTSLGGADKNLQYIRDQLISKIRQFARCDRPAPAIFPPRSASFPAPGKTNILPKSAESIRNTTRNVPRQILAIGVSTGGPNALGKFLPMLPKSLPVPIVIVQHMPPLFTHLLAERLDASCDIAVKEAGSGMVLQPGTAYIAPGDQHLVLKRVGTQVITALHQGPPENSCRPAVDVLFRSVAEVYGEATVAVILTGMGKDGFCGIQVLKKQGAFVIAQDKATSVVWGMPGFVVEAGLANVVVPIDHVAIEVERCLLSSTVNRA